MPPSEAPAALPLARWASRRLAEFTDVPAIAELSGETLLGERAALNGFSVPHQRSAGGGCELIEARDGWIALNLARDADRELLPAWLEESAEDVTATIKRRSAAALVERGREMGLALASFDEMPVSPAVELLVPGNPALPPNHTPLVVDLSALWAGPLAGHLLWLAGAKVVKVESKARPDAMRHGDPAMFARLNQGKASVAFHFASHDGRSALSALLTRADIVIEASRPRAMRQLGIDAAALVAAKPGKVWLTLTGHGASGAAADWVGFGDDCSVAGGLSTALRDATGVIGFGGDAVADPLSGILAAQEAWQAWRAGQGGRIGVALSGVVAHAIAEERAHDPAQFEQDLRDWTKGRGAPFPPITPRKITAKVAALGEDNARYLG